MKLLCVFALFICIQSEKMIKNIQYNSCRNCVHFRPHPYDLYSSNSFGKCANFGEKNIITDKIEYSYADACRRSESECGVSGKYFEEEPNVNLKILKHQFFLFFCVAFLIFIIERTI